jgi:hypothetical protein
LVDLFDEVEEQLRSERYKALAFRILPWAGGIAAAALLSALGWWWWQERTDTAGFAAAEQYSTAVQSVAQGDETRAYGQFEEVATSGPPVYKAMAMMHQGAIRLDAGKTEEAVALFDKAAEAAPDPLLADLARLKSAFALLDTAPYAELEERLTPLTEDERPYRNEAGEALAFAKLLDGKTEEARGDFAVLSLSPDSSDAVRQRSRAAMDMIDSGSAKSLPDVVAAAAEVKSPQQQPVPVQPGAAQ